MWTVVFCPKVEYYLGNVDTKIVNLYFGVHITSALRKCCPQKVPTISMDRHFAVDWNFQWTVMLSV